jgi:hypothetical protein
MHIDCDNFKADLLLPVDSESKIQKYKTVRRIPPGSRKYFFSIQGNEYCANDHSKVS